MLILSAGMERSASTWLYNVIRFLIQKSEHFSGDISFGWIDDVSSLVELSSKGNDSTLVVKVHQYNEELADKAHFIFYSYRDLRDVLASLKRKFNTEPTNGLAKSLIKKDKLWCDLANYSMRYENMLIDKTNEVENIARCLGINDVKAEVILAQLDELSYESNGQRNNVYNQDNLFHKGHITDGKVGSWQNELSVGFVAELTTQHKAWFVKNSYSV